MRKRHPLILLALLAFAACGGGRGCPADPGAFCTPNQSDCRGDYYCSAGGICTKECGPDADCKPACKNAEDCGASDDGQDIWSCTSGACECAGGICPESPSCIDGHCQLSCALDGTGPTNDPYAPRS